MLPRWSLVADTTVISGYVLVCACRASFSTRVSRACVRCSIPAAGPPIKHCPNDAHGVALHATRRLPCRCQHPWCTRWHPLCRECCSTAAAWAWKVGGAHAVPCRVRKLRCYVVHQLSEMDSLWPYEFIAYVTRSSADLTLGLSIPQAALCIPSWAICTT